MSADEYPEVADFLDFPTVFDTTGRDVVETRLLDAVLGAVTGAAEAAVCNTLDDELSTGAITA